MRALICGAGVGGLSAGIALQRAGFEVQVLERAPDLRVSGFGLNLWPNAGRALNALGLQSAYEAISVPLKRYWTIASTGEVMYERDVADWSERYGAPATGVYRRELSSMLVDALGTEHIRFGQELVDVRDEGRRVVCLSQLVRRPWATFSSAPTESTRRPAPVCSARWIIVRTRIIRTAGAVTSGSRTPTSTLRPRPRSSVDGPSSGRSPLATDGHTGLRPGRASTPWTTSWRCSAPGSTPTFRGRSRRVQGGDPADQASGSGRAAGEVDCGAGDAAGGRGAPDDARPCPGRQPDLRGLRGARRMPLGCRSVVDGLREYEERRRPVAYSVVEFSSRGMFAPSRDGSDREEVDPISLRYERGVEGAADVAV